MRYLFFFLFFLNSIFAIDLSKIQEGDIIFQESESIQSTAIKLATNSRYTHVGIIFKYKKGFQVLEAIEPVKKTSLDEFIERGKNQHFVIKRLKNKELLTIEIIQKMKDYGNSLLGKHYDIFFNWSDKEIYCTELIWKMYFHSTKLKIGDLKTLKDFDLSSKVVKDLMRKRYGEKIPYEEPVISPVDMFESKQLIKVMEEN